MSAWTATTRRRVRSLIGALIEADWLQKADPWIDREATALLPLLVERKAPAKRLPGKSRKADRAERRERHARETAEIRRKVFERADGRCEMVFTVVNAFSAYNERCRGVPTELHHTVMGSGRRRQKQTVENCRAYCFECHRAAHRAAKREGAP